MINKVIDYLKKQFNYDIPTSYYVHIKEWENWWKGYYKPFHSYKEISFNGNIIERKLYSLKMAKKICEDWASLLLNEKTEITCEDETSNKFLQGDNQTQGVFGYNQFWSNANSLVEKAFYSGTGAFITRLEKMLVIGESIQQSEDTKIRLEYVKADQIIPLSIKYGEVIEVAFVSEVLEKGKKYIYIEMHTLEDNHYRITNKYLQDKDAGLVEVELPKGIIESYVTDAEVSLFSIIKPNTVNNIDTNTALGISIFANAIDNLEGIDLAYNNFNRDFKLGGKKVFINKDLTQQDDNGNVITPDDMAQQLFSMIGDSNLVDKDTLIQEHNPDLRVQQNKDGVQAQLDYLSFKCGLGTKHYQFNGGSVVTATQYSGDKQDLVQNAAKHYINIEKALIGIVRAILYLGNRTIDSSVDYETEINVTFDDSFIIDKEAERQRDLQEIREGLKAKWEYRIKWFGESEEEAKNAISDIGTITSLFGE